MVLSDVIDLNHGKVVALFDNNPTVSSCLDDVPIYFGEVGFREWFKAQSSIDNLFAGIAIGGGHGEVRIEIGQLLLDAGLRLPVLIHPSAIVSRTAKLDLGSQVLANAVVAAGTTVGRTSIINNSANVDHECVLGNGVHIAPGTVLCGCVTVGDYSFIGANAVVLPRLRIGRSVVVGAGAVVTRDVPDYSVVAGNPAVLLGTKND
jgi:sugar O-acyltransferase (sialic acid O-acetyltransferase NeuD family)